jgi:hypothetical protein
MTTSSSKRHTTPGGGDRADFGLNSRVPREAPTFQRDDLVGVVSMSNRIVAGETAVAARRLPDEVEQSVFVINSI